MKVFFSLVKQVQSFCEATMRILGINHVGLAPKDPAKAKWFLEVALALPPLGEELVASQNTLTTMFDSNARSSTARLEILENEDGKDGPIKKFLEKKGAGIHHLAMTVDSVDAAIKRMQSLNVKMIDVQPRPGAHNTKIAFVHPESTGGLLVEFVEEKKKGF
jgi:methylmalonyl-CoA/ethylmalonyl-CoA epimerase